MHHPPQLRMRQGFVDPGTLAVIALLAVGAISLATTSGAVEQAIGFDAAAEVATEVTAPSPAPLPAEPAPPPVNVPPVNAPEQPQPPRQPAVPEIAPIDDDRPEPPPNPQECRDVRQQIRDQFRELNRFEKLLRKLRLTAELEQLVALRAKLKEFDRAIQQACTRDNLQEFWDEQVWEEINKFRCKAELPQQHVQIERELKRLEKQSTPKRMQFTGLDQERYKANLGKVKQALADAKAAVASGSCEDANEAMQTFWEEGMHPGEIMGVINRLYELGKQLARVKDENVRQLFVEVLQPVIDSANEGDFRDANQALNDVFGELQQLLHKVINRRQYRGYEPRLQKLEELLREKLGDEREPGGAVTAPSAVSGPFLGGWRVETIFGLDAQGQWSESAIAPYKPTYVEFTADGSSCVTDTAERACTTYNRYQVEGQTISFPGATSSRLIWRMVGEKLEIVHEGLVDGTWAPNIKFIAVKVR